MPKFKIEIEHSEIITAASEEDCFKHFCDNIHINPFEFLNRIMTIEELLDVELCSEKEMLEKYK